MRGGIAGRRSGSLGRGLDQRAKRDKAISGGDLGKAMLVRIADDERDAFEGGNLLGRALRIASGNNDLRAEGLARWMRRMAARASWSAEEVTVQVFKTTTSAAAAVAGSRQTALGQLAFDGRTVGLGGATTEIFNIETAHRSIIWAPPDSTGSSVLLREDCFPAEQNPVRLNASKRRGGST